MDGQGDVPVGPDVPALCKHICNSTRLLIDCGASDPLDQKCVEKTEMIRKFATDVGCRALMVEKNIQGTDIDEEADITWSISTDVRYGSARATGEKIISFWKNLHFYFRCYFHQNWKHHRNWQIHSWPTSINRAARRLTLRKSSSVSLLRGVSLLQIVLARIFKSRRFARLLGRQNGAKRREEISWIRNGSASSSAKRRHSRDFPDAASDHFAYHKIMQWTR